MSGSPQGFPPFPNPANDGMAPVIRHYSRRAGRAISLAADVGPALRSPNPSAEALAVRQSYFGVALSEDAGESEQYPHPA